MKLLRFNLLALIVSLTMLLTACGSSQKAEEPAPAPEPVAAPTAEPAPVPTAAPTPSNATVGQKLIDLNNAKEAGAISDEEYEAVKQRLLQTD